MNYCYKVYHHNYKIAEFYSLEDVYIFLNGYNRQYVTTPKLEFKICRLVNDTEAPNNE